MINLVTSFFNKKEFPHARDNRSELRNNELKEALLMNLKSIHIKKIHLFIDDEYSMNILTNLIKDNENRDKIVIINHYGQAIYSDYFKYIYENIDNEVVMLCNSDIYLAECDMKLIDKYIVKQDNIFCITRHESDTEKPLIDRYKYSHDAYIFKSPINKEIINLTGFKQNLWGVENLLMFIFREYGYKLYNPCLQIKIIHKHKSEYRERGRTKVDYGAYVTGYKSAKILPTILD